MKLNWAVLTSRFLLIAVLGFGGSIALAQDDIKPSAKLGLAFPGSDPRTYKFVRDAGIGVVRLSVNWSLIERRPGQYNFRAMDGRVAALQALGLIPFLTFETPAAWYSKPGTGKTSKNSEPADMEKWAQFVRLTVERYDGDGQGDAPRLRFGVRFFQVANEFISPTNRSGGWDSTNTALLTYINTAQSAAKSASSRVIFVMGGVASFNVDLALLADTGSRFTLKQRWSKSSQTVVREQDINSRQVRDLLENRLKYILRNAKYDRAAVHLYGPENRDAARISYIKKLSRRPVLSTECGGPSLDYDTNYTASLHAQAVIERNLGVLAEGLPFCLWLGLGEEMTTTYGNRKLPLYDKSRRPKPGVNAYRLLAQMIGSDGRVDRISGGGYRIRSGQGTFCAGSSGTTAAGLAKSCGANTPAVCWDGKTKGFTWIGSAGNMAQACSGAVVLISGKSVGSLKL